MTTHLALGLSRLAAFLSRPRARLVSRAVAPAIVLVVALGAVSCGSGDFQPQNVVDTVRILASRADKPYAAPGDKVNIEVLAFDGRAKKPAPMGIFWIPIPCVNPTNDAYYSCFSALSGAGGKGGGGGGGPALPPGVDLTPVLPSGPTFSITMPSNIIATHPPVPGTDPYGLVIVFNMACAGHVEILPIDPGNINPQALPIGCFDAAHNRLGPSDYVFGYTRVYAYANKTNQNPVIDHVEIDGARVDPAVGITVDRCDGCPEHAFDVFAPDSDQEVNPGDLNTSGDTRNEAVWATFYTTKGKFGNDATLLFDAVAGKITDNKVKYDAPADPGDGFLWVVIHDNRDGASWLQLPLHVK